MTNIEYYVLNDDSLHFICYSVDYIVNASLNFSLGSLVLESGEIQAMPIAWAYPKFLWEGAISNRTNPQLSEGALGQG